MKTVQPTYETIKEQLSESKTIYIRVGKNNVKIQNCYKDKKGIVYALSSVGEHRIDLYSELYVE
jgi:hypothetical protein